MLAERRKQPWTPSAACPLLVASRESGSRRPCEPTGDGHQPVAGGLAGPPATTLAAGDEEGTRRRRGPGLLSPLRKHSASRAQPASGSGGERQSWRECRVGDGAAVRSARGRLLVLDHNGSVRQPGLAEIPLARCAF